LPRYEHLQLFRLPESLARRKRRGGGEVPQRNVGGHSRKLRAELDAVVAEQRRRRPPEFIDPSLILRVRMTGMTMEEEWERLGLTVLASDEDKTLVLFASNEEMRDFRSRLQAYSEGTPRGQVGPRYTGFISRVEEIGEVEPRDRIGLRLREEGLTEPDHFAEGRAFVLDVELWDIGRRELRAQKLQRLADYLESRGGEVLDRYIGPSITMLRARMPGSVVQTLLTLEDIADLDLPPEPDITTGDALEMSVADMPTIADATDSPPVIGIVDSGVNDHPLLEGAIVGAIGVPGQLGTADEWGHGTRVAGIALFGDLREQLASGTLTRVGRIASAKVVNETGRFDDRRLVPSQMREALTSLNQSFGCRLFVVALGDPKRTYDGGKVGPWAATLDELARELDSVIVVSAGNRAPRGGGRLEQAITEYPRYLLEPANRFCEPAGAMNVLTVGALAHSEGIGAELSDHVHIRSITRAFEPAPFTRIGPGIGGTIKPDLVDVGGTMVFDGAVARLRRGEDLPTAGVLTLHHDFGDRLFTAGSGTSYAAPRVAYKAAQILTLFPNASANLVRALLVGSSRIPDEAQRRFAELGEAALRVVCGHGAVDTERASYSDEHRVVLYAEDEIPLDYFAVYQLPIPDLFQGGGKRSIRVTLAFDPPVRHTRADYAGVGMNFRLVRGCNPNLIFEHFRQRTKDEGRQPELKGYNCDLQPGPNERERGTLQTATVSFSRSTQKYGDSYYLVVRSEAGWAANFLTRQRFAVVVELVHQAEVRLYERLRARVRLQA
jgi:hypothetical protein